MMRSLARISAQWYTVGKEWGQGSFAGEPPASPARRRFSVLVGTVGTRPRNLRGRENNVCPGCGGGVLDCIGGEILQKEVHPRPSGFNLTPQRFDAKPKSQQILLFYIEKTKTKKPGRLPHNLHKSQFHRDWR
uniref:Uncharacterized protein n=1 Tax=Rousettus aegyptiacus TaxID=9407 RepID=A0A7J8CIE7_ROUAE|nr:hypothetical protein HJG63_009103 [Rousettus aegyptiacus]